MSDELLLLTGPTTSAASQQAAGLGPQQFSKDVEDEANSYFQRIYNTSGSSQHSAITIVEQVLEMLKNFKDSPSDRDKVRVNSPVNVVIMLLYLKHCLRTWSQTDHSAFISSGFSRKKCVNVHVCYRKCFSAC